MNIWPQLIILGAATIQTLTVPLEPTVHADPDGPNPPNYHRRALGSVAGESPPAGFVSAYLLATAAAKQGAAAARTKRLEAPPWRTGSAAARSPAGSADGCAESSRTPGGRDCRLGAPRPAPQLRRT